jgi:hypothetical protein
MPRGDKPVPATAPSPAAVGRSFSPSCLGILSFRRARRGNVNLARFRHHPSSGSISGSIYSDGEERASGSRIGPAQGGAIGETG